MTYHILNHCLIPCKLLRYCKLFMSLLKVIWSFFYYWESNKLTICSHLCLSDTIIKVIFSFQTGNKGFNKKFTTSKYLKISNYIKMRENNLIWILYTFINPGRNLVHSMDYVRLCASDHINISVSEQHKLIL